MKNCLFITLILLCARYALSQEFCNYPVIGPHAYNSKLAPKIVPLFTRASDKDGLYKVMVNDIAAYTDCGTKIKYKKDDYIYVSGERDFLVGNYKGKSGKWAETLVDLDSTGPQYGTFIYVFFKDLKHEEPEYNYALGELSKTNPFILAKGEEGVYQVKSRKDFYDEQGKIYTGIGLNNLIKVYHYDFFQGSFKGKSGIWVRTEVDRLKSIYTPLSNLKMVTPRYQSANNPFYQKHIGWIVFIGALILIAVIIAYNSTSNKIPISTGASYTGRSFEPFTPLTNFKYESSAPADYSKIFPINSGSQSSNSMSNNQPKAPVNDPIGNMHDWIGKKHEKEAIDSDIAYYERLGGHDSNINDLKNKRDRL